MNICVYLLTYFGCLAASRRRLTELYINSKNYTDALNEAYSLIRNVKSNVQDWPSKLMNSIPSRVSEAAVSDWLSWELVWIFSNHFPSMLASNPTVQTAKVVFIKMVIVIAKSIVQSVKGSVTVFSLSSSRKKLNSVTTFSSRALPKENLHCFTLVNWKRDILR